MKKNTSLQKGFSAIEILLLLFIILLLILLGLYVGSKKKKPNQTPSNSSSQQSTPATPEPTTTKYLEIKEFAVKLPLSNEIDGLYYVLRPKTAGDPAEYADIFDKGFDGTSNKNGVKCKDDKFPLFVIGRVKPADMDQIAEQDKGSYKQLAVSDVYQFSGAPAQQAYPQCAYLTADSQTTDNNILELFITKKKAIVLSFSKIEKL